MASRFLVIDPANPVPPSAQIATQIRTPIASGELRPGDPLPSVRQLARDLGVAPNTVVRAYSDLQHDGWIIPKPRKGFSVASDVSRLAAGERSRQLEDAAEQLAETAHRMGANGREIHALIDRWLQHASG